MGGWGGLRKLAQSVFCGARWRDGCEAPTGLFFVLSVCVKERERDTPREGESGRDASWKMTAFNKYVGGNTLHREKKHNGGPLGLEIATPQSRFGILPVMTVR